MNATDVKTAYNNYINKQKERYESKITDIHNELKAQFDEDIKNGTLMRLATNGSKGKKYDKKYDCDELKKAFAKFEMVEYPSTNNGYYPVYNNLFPRFKERSFLGFSLNKCNSAIYFDDDAKFVKFYKDMNGNIKYIDRYDW